MTFKLEFGWAEVIAVYAGVVSTIVLAWDIWKYRHSGPQLDVAVQTGMKMVGDPQFKDKTLMTMRATNRGDRPTTLTHFTLHKYDSWWQFVRKRASYNAIVNTWGPGIQRTPHVLQPGEVWTGIADQTADIEQMARDGRVYLGLVHSHSKKTILRRVLAK